MTLPPWLLELLAGGAAEVEGVKLDAGLALLGRRVAGRLHEATPAAARDELLRQSASLPVAGALMDRVTEHRIPIAGGEIAARLYTPADLRPQPPGLVFYHGGGWVLGSLDSHDAFCRLVAGQAPCKVLSVDYRLAPEHRFPAAVDDAVAAFRFAATRAEELGIDPRRLAVGGDSAGGTLATVVARLCSGDPVRPCGQLLICPVTSARRDTRSYELFAKGFGLTSALMDWFFEHYLNDPSEGEDPRVSPLLADLSGLPPAILAVAHFDVLRDEGEAYARRLQAAGVDTVVRRFPLIHSFIRPSGLPVCRQAIDETISELANLFHRLKALR